MKDTEWEATLRRIASDLRDQGGEDKYDDADLLDDLADFFRARDILKAVKP